jgi:hypothetical protein
MKKVFYLLSSLFLLQLSASAQIDDAKFIVILSPQISMPIGSFKSSNKIGFGGHISTEFAKEKIRFLASLGGSLYGGKTYESDPGYSEEYPSVAITQLRGGLKYFISKGLFCVGQIGVAHVYQEGESGTGFTYSPAIGYEFGLGDISVKYEATTIKTATGNSATTIGLSIGYHF